MLPRPLRFGVDSLEASFTGILSGELIARLNVARAAAIATDVPCPVMLAGREFFIQPKGLGPYRFRARDEELDLRITDSEKLPSIWLRASAVGLAAKGHEALYTEAKALCKELGARDALGLSRLDVACDFQGWEPSEEELANVVTKAAYSAVHRSGQGRTFQWGKGASVLRLYHKSAEIVAKRKAYMRELWTHLPGFDPDEAVWRVELQLRSERLRELDVRAPADAFPRLGDILAWGMHWVELRVPQTDQTVTRWPVDPRWAALYESYKTGRPVERIRRARRSIGRYDAIRRALSPLSTFGAYEGHSDFWELWSALGAELEGIIEGEELELDGLIEDKRCKLGFSRE